MKWFMFLRNTLIFQIDITHVPQPPAQFASRPSRDEGFEVIEVHEISSVSSRGSRSQNTPEEDDALFSRLFDSLEQQVKVFKNIIVFGKNAQNIRRLDTAMEKPIQVSQCVY